jgi:hypothetical protein
MLSDEARRRLWELEEAFPAHTCVDQPNLSCPACLKWTGDGFATVKANPQCFPDITREPALDLTHYGTSGYAVMIRVRLAGGWAWRTWMRYATEAEALAHAREGTTVVPFGSAEWMEVMNMKDVAPPSLRPEPIPRQPRDIYRFVRSGLRFLHRHVFPAQYAKAIRDSLPECEDLVHQPLVPK